ncbi:FG-GAP repeat domain-containing protein [Rubinisphaera margarita]|uniref:FG-GAP repeat domain-containing protein n=1 Tax=Rubinisphaera margarita TaxID=2909586 RepID=UPI001EE7854F|nr:VCBS repeat-containing protein [Rubinisphaera margarita]MCG6158247.1 VCBS repeat-containing protein [Rubinisphaera margarita]
MLRGCLLVLALAGCSGNESNPVETADEPTPGPVRPSPIQFTQSAALADADVRYQNSVETGHDSILESLGGGVGICDFDLDGHLDLCFPGGGVLKDRTVSGLPSRLLQQRGEDQFVDISVAALIDKPLHYSHGCSVADFNADGFPDMLITGYGGLTLWVNMGDGTFINGTEEAGLDDTSWSTSAAWTDFNGDGALDLYVTHYVDWSFDNDPECNGPSGVRDVCPPRRFEGLDDILYLSNGDGTFRDGTSSANLVSSGKGLGVVSADLDIDGDMDCYVANDTTPNFFYVNDGNGTFREEGLASGLALDDMGTPNGSMGLAILDYDGDGRPDIGVSNYERELFALYQNLGSATFQHTSRMTGLNRIGNLFVGFGCVTGDFDADGDEEITVANGHVVHRPLNAPVRQKPLMLVNEGAGVFERIEPERLGGYFNENSLGRGLATGDIDRDGLLDLVFVNTNDPAVLLHNRSQATNETGQTRGLHLQLSGTIAPRDAIGTWAELETDAGVQVRHLCGGGSYLSTNEIALHWHWKADVVPKELRVHWPGGTVSTIPWSSLEQGEQAIVSCLIVESTTPDETPQLHFRNQSSSAQ